jgi:hypothetical protein
MQLLVRLFPSRGLVAQQRRVGRAVTRQEGLRCLTSGFSRISIFRGAVSSTLWTPRTQRQKQDSDSHYVPRGHYDSASSEIPMAIYTSTVGASADVEVIPAC